MSTEKIYQTTNYKVSGMTCTACALSLEKHLSKESGVKKAQVNYPNNSIILEYDSSKTSLQRIGEKAKNIGYTIITGDTSEITNNFEVLEQKRLTSLKRKLVIAVIFSTPVFVISMFLMGQFPFQNWLLLVLSIPVILWSGSEFYVNAFKKLTFLNANMDTLVALSTGVAFLFSVFNTVYPEYFLNKGIAPHVYYESAVIIITFILLGRFFEEKAKSKTSSAIQKLMGLTPKEITVIRNGEELTIATDEIVTSELIIIKPGDKIPVDGKVKKGISFIDESMITGEPIPVEKTKGNLVYAGTINQKGALRIIATKVGKDTLLSQIVQLVKQAQNSKPKIQKLADKIAGIFVPAVLLIALITFFIWLFIGPEPPITHAIVSVITVLIIACPCALGLATPTALIVGIGKAAENGILIKDAQVLETAYKIDTLVLDKTGTITHGKPLITDFLSVKEANIVAIQKGVLAIESQSEHPIALSIVEYLKDKGIEVDNPQSFQSITGMGTNGIYDGNQYFIGNKTLMDNNSVEIPEELKSNIKRLQSEGKTLVFVSINKRVKVIYAISDSIKTNAKYAIQKLQKSGINVHMLTGDIYEAAKSTANQVGITNFKAHVLPNEKGNYIKELQNKGHLVAMAGDGINDAHALAQADVGIAMGDGTDIAIESSGITLTNSNLNQIVKSLQLSKATLKTIKQNLFWAFIYNIVAIPIAAGILYPINGFLLNPMIAGAAMALSSISVILNSLRLKKYTFN